MDNNLEKSDFVKNYSMSNEQIKKDIGLIKKILHETNMVFDESYKIFFAVALCYFINFIISIVTTISAIYYMRSTYLKQTPLFNVPLTESIIDYVFPVIVFIIIYAMKKKTIKDNNVMGNYLINIWAIGIMTILFSGFLLLNRHFYISHFGNGEMYLNSISIELFVAGTVLTIIYFCTAMISNKSLFKTIGIINAVIFSLAVIFIPISILDVADYTVGKAAFAALQRELPTLLVFINLLIVGIILKNNNIKEKMS